VQAHLVSQLLSHVLDQRPLLRPLSLPLEALWITAWALLGAILTPIAFCPQRRSPYWRALLIGSGLTLLLYACCWLALLGGLWLPLVPPAIALSTTSLIAGAPLSQKHPPRGRAISAS
jgi:CHASE2 domain-containing sensor protein